ncbi:hypothetical protein [Aeromicrobium sp. Leaf350]|uniref:hypothetical protein n=1 Tax=Aeromicrobium sp. Leaf350 TaxID=2876565 RepID=UPI001E2FC59C|nr:hypothetical protein [Aeromicrobium sp. Leaf350]
MNRRTRVWAVALTLTAGLVLSACGEEDPESESSSTPSASESSPAPTTASPTPETPALPQVASDLVGTWRDDTADWTANFAADGTFTWDYQGNTGFLTGTYTLESGVVTFAGNDGNDLAGQVTPQGLVFTLGTLTPR